MLIYCGIPTTQQSFLDIARSIDSALLVSANTFWKDGKFIGERINDIHFTKARKEAARAAKEK